ncbi:hypothetical protein LTS18_006772, partial [Coniosporium uncinatum]
MFGFLTNLFTTMVAVLLPAFAAFKALRTANVPQMTAWLTYFVVFAMVREVEIFFDFITRWIPFFNWAALLLHIYLMLPGDQGATLIYKNYVNPTFMKYETDIENFITKVHDISVKYFRQFPEMALKWLKAMLTGQQPPPPPPPPRNTNWTQQFLASYAPQNMHNIDPAA